MKPDRLSLQRHSSRRHVLYFVSDIRRPTEDMAIERVFARRRLRALKAEEAVLWALDLLVPCASTEFSQRRLKALATAYATVTGLIVDHEHVAAALDRVEMVLLDEEVCDGEYGAGGGAG
jgi:hypothetical protein